MADGLNDARAMRIAEVLNDYQAIQTQLASFRSYLDQTQPGQAGHTVLNSVLNEAAALLAIPFSGPNPTVPTSPGEGTKRQLQSILLDAAARRFRAMRLYLRASAGIRWIQRRNNLLGGRQPTAAHGPALAQIDNALRTEIIAVTDQKVFTELHQKDIAASNWTGEMPTLSRIQQFIQQQN